MSFSRQSHDTTNPRYSMRKSRSRFALMPQSIREQINRQLDDGAQYEQIRAWLFAQTADRDIPALELKTGDPYSLCWTRTATDDNVVIRNFGVALSGWYHTHYARWREEQADRDESHLMLEHVEQLTNDASTQNRPTAHLGGNLLVRSLILQSLTQTRKGKNDPNHIARLANAWARVSQVDEHTVEIGFQTLLEEIKSNPKAVEIFHHLRTEVRHTTKPSTSN